LDEIEAASSVALPSSLSRYSSTRRPLCAPIVGLPPSTWNNTGRTPAHEFRISWEK